MKVLYSFLGVGNGHASRARELIPELQKHCTVTIASSGRCVEVSSDLPVDLHFRGLGFYFGKTGGIDLGKTFWELAALPGLIRDIRRIPIQSYDLVINDCEPVTAYAARRWGVPLVSMSHQASFASPKTPRAKPVNFVHEAIMKKYAPFKYKIGFHFDRYDSFIETPVIRSGVRMIQPHDTGHVLVYLPAYDESHIIEVLRQLPEIRWEVFSKHAEYEFTFGNVSIRKINNERYLESLAGAHGVLTGGGFETPSEAIFLGKRLFVIPQHGQYEQQCNAAALQLKGIPTDRRLSAATIPKLRRWLRSTQPTRELYPEHTSRVVQKALWYARQCSKSVSVLHA